MIIFWIIVFTIFSAIFSGMELAFVSANRVGIEIEKNKESLRGKIFSYFYNNPKEFIGAMLIGNNISLVILTFLFSQLLDSHVTGILDSDVIKLLIETLIITAFILVFAEFLPKTIFSVYANKSMLALSLPVYFITLILRIPTLFFTYISTFILKYIFKTKVIEDNIQLTRIDLKNFVDSNITEEDDIEKEMFQKALNLDQVKARDVMIPRNEIITVDKTISREKLKQVFSESRHSRIIIIDGDIENILGYIHHQQLIINNIKNAGDQIMPIDFVPETVNAKDLLMQFIKDKQSIAIVVDEYGSVAGLITIEDLMEEIFGEIEDEYDKEDTVEKVLSDNEYIFSGRLEIDYINENYKAINLPDEEYNTLSGLVVMTSGNIPLVGDKIEIENYTFEVLKIDEKKVELIKIIKNDIEE